MGCELRRQLREPGAFCVASMANCLGGAGTTGGLFFVYQALLRFWCLRLSPAWAQATEAVCRCCCCCCTGPRSPSSFDGSLAGWGLSVRSGVVARRAAGCPSLSFVRSFVAKHCCNRVARAAAGGGRRADARSRGGGLVGCVGGRTSYGRRRNRGPGSCRRVHSTDQAQAPSNNRGVVVCSVRTSSIWGGCLVLTGTGQELQPSRLPPLLTTTNPLEGR